jgi:4'-phosphopantetheinyl transferase
VIAGLLPVDTKNLEASFDLSRGEVEVWILRVEPSAENAATFDRFLVSAEQDRARRFLFDHLRQSYTVTRGVLRCLLGRYLQTDPAKVAIEYTRNGKPCLSSDESLEFNLSHSGQLAVFSFTRGCELGIDVEEIRAVPEMNEIASSHFSPEEGIELGTLADADREPGFFRCWTRKEAYLKATGDGLSAPLKDFRVTLLPGVPCRFVHISHSADIAREWTLQNVDVPSGYASALAYRGTARPAHLFPVFGPSDLLRITRP